MYGPKVCYIVITKIIQFIILYQTSILAKCTVLAKSHNLTRIGIYDVEEELDIEFPEDRDYDTLGGYIFFKLEKIPEKGESVTFKNWIFEVMELSENRIKTVHVKKINE